MGRKPKLLTRNDGSIELRTTIPPEIARVLQQLASDMGIDVPAALNMMLGQIAGMLDVGQAGYLGPLFERALKRAREANFGMISAGPKIDLSKLHTTDRTKSGYVGIYASGRGFRAMAKINGTLTSIGTFQSVEEAAWKRYLYYRENRLPYGELEADMAEWRKTGFKGSDEQLIDAIMVTARDCGTTHYYKNDLAMLREGGVRVPDASDDDGPRGLKGFSEAEAEAFLSGEIK